MSGGDGFAAGIEQASVVDVFCRHRFGGRCLRNKEEADDDDVDQDACNRKHVQMSECLFLCDVSNRTQPRTQSDTKYRSGKAE